VEYEVEYSLENRNLTLVDVFLCLCMYIRTYVFMHVCTYVCGRDSAVSSDTLRAGRSGDRIPVGTRFSAPLQTGLGPTQPPIQWVPGLSGGKTVGVWRWPPTPI
jgi:hypothetical protein